MKSMKNFLLAAALLAGQYVSAQNFRVNTYTDVLGNQITEFRDNRGQVVRKECVSVDIFGDTIVTVYDQYGVRVEQITYHTDILGTTIITIRDRYGVVIEKVEYSTNALGRAVAKIFNKYGDIVKYNESYFYRSGKLYGDYARYCHYRSSQPAHKNRKNVTTERHRSELQRPTHPPQSRTPRAEEGRKPGNHKESRPSAPKRDEKFRKETSQPKGSRPGGPKR